MSKRNKVLLSTIVVGALGSLAAFGIFGLFSSTTQNAGNEIRTGTVAITDNDAGSAQFNVTNARPGDSWVRCIKVSYNGSLPADVRQYVQETPGALLPYMNIKIEQGTQATSAFPGCTGFTPDATGTLVDGPMGGPPGTYDTGLPITPAGQSNWLTGDSLVFRTTMTLSASAPDNAQAASTGPATVVWEARNDT